MTHTYHQDLPGYDPRQILHDGCPECERRGEDPVLALNNMDPSTFKRALDRAVEWQTGQLYTPLNLSRAESRVLETIWMVALHMVRSGDVQIEGVRA